MGCMQDARYKPGTIKTFLAKSQNSAANLALITQSTQQSALDLTLQMDPAAADKRFADKLALAQKLKPRAEELHAAQAARSMIYFADGVDTRHASTTS